jgi:hypothetical protein
LCDFFRHGHLADERTHTVVGPGRHERPTSIDGRTVDTAHGLVEASVHRLGAESLVSAGVEWRISVGAARAAVCENRIAAA